MVKLSDESHVATSQELRIATQKSRIAELEGSLTLASENTNNIRKQNIVYLDKNETIR